MLFFLQNLATLSKIFHFWSFNKNSNYQCKTNEIYNKNCFIKHSAKLLLDKNIFLANLKRKFSWKNI